MFVFLIIFSKDKPKFLLFYDIIEIFTIIKIEELIEQEECDFPEPDESDTNEIRTGLLSKIEKYEAEFFPAKNENKLGKLFI